VSLQWVYTQSCHENTNIGILLRDKNLELFLLFQDSNKFSQTELYFFAAPKKIK